MTLGNMRGLVGGVAMGQIMLVHALGAAVCSRTTWRSPR